jgi:virulence-associated protein VapD
MSDTNFRDNLKGRQQALFDDLQAILRNYGYNEDQAVVAFKTLTESEEG